MGRSFVLTDVVFEALGGGHFLAQLSHKAQLGPTHSYLNPSVHITSSTSNSGLWSLHNCDRVEKRFFCCAVKETVTLCAATLVSPSTFNSAALQPRPVCLVWGGRLVSKHKSMIECFSTRMNYNLTWIHKGSWESANIDCESASVWFLIYRSSVPLFLRSEPLFLKLLKNYVATIIKYFFSCALKRNSVPWFSGRNSFPLLWTVVAKLYIRSICFIILYYLAYCCP